MVKEKSSAANSGQKAKTLKWTPVARMIDVQKIDWKRPLKRSFAQSGESSVGDSLGSPGAPVWCA